MAKSLKNFKIDLQLHNDFFGEGGEPEAPNPILGEASEPVEATPEEGATTEEEATTEEVTPGEATEGQEATEGATEPEGILMTDDNGPKPGPDPIEGIQARLDEIMNRMGTPKEEVAEVEEAVEELTEEEIEKMNNEFYLKFTERPLEAMEEIIETRANEKLEREIKPIRDHLQQLQKVEVFTKVIEDFKTTNPDFDEYIEEVTQIIQNDEGIRNSKNPLDVAYKFAKAERLESKIKEMEAKQGVPLSESMKNKDTLRELLKDKEIKNLIFQELKLDKGETPKVIGGKGSTTVTVKDKPTSIEEGTKAWLNS